MRTYNCYLKKIHFFAALNRLIFYNSYLNVTN